MFKIATTARWLSAAIGGALVVALQTPPDTAASNAALWIENITGHLPNLPRWAEALGTALGIILILVPFALWLRKRFRRRGWSDRSIEGLRRVMEGCEPQAQIAPRHREILQALPRPLATVQEQALTYGDRDLQKMRGAKAEAEALISEIPYDRGTAQTVRDFLQACVNAAEPHDSADEMREARQDVARIAPTLFRQLHAGESVDRFQVDLPAWCRVDEQMPKQPPRWTDDSYKDEWDYLADGKPVERDTPLGEALAFIAYRRWGRDYSQTAADALNEFRQRAYDDKISVWGRFDSADVWRKIPAEHWSDHSVDAGALLNGYARTWGHDCTRYGFLMVSRAEIEREWGHEK
jgi:hypothetical protein